MRYWVVLGLSLISFSAVAKTSGPNLPRKSKAEKCSDLLVAEESRIPTRRLWNGDELNPAFTSISDVNGVLLQEIAKFVKAKKHFPEEKDLVKALKPYVTDQDDEEEGKKAKNLLRGVVKDFPSYFALKNAAKDWKTLCRLTIQEIPESVKDFRAAARTHMMKYFKKHLRLPSVMELASHGKMDEWLLSEIYDPQTEWDVARRENGIEFLDARNKVIKAFLRAAQQRDRPAERRIQKSTPDVEEIFWALVRDGGNKQLLADHLENIFTVDNVKQMLNLPVENERPSTDAIANPVLFPEGIVQVEQEARVQSPQSFKNYLSESQFALEKMELARDVITQKNGFLATSVTAGIDLDEEQFALMLRYAEDHDYPILVFPTNQVLEGLDERLLNHPRIHIVTNNIENDFMKIWQIPILPKNQNPFASLDQRGQFVPGQLVIVGHPQIAHKIIPTGSNHLRETPLWSTGSLSRRLYPYLHEVQGRTSALASNYHKNGFLVVQKADARSGLAEEGTQNFWHVRPVEYVDDRKFGQGAGFTDLGKRYSVVLDDTGTPVLDEEGFARTQVKRVDPTSLFVADLHDRVADQRMLRAYENLIQRFPDLRDVFIEDPIDGYSHNHWEAKSVSLLIKKFMNGDLDYHKEMMGLVQTTNSFLRFRENLRVYFPDSNHSYWGRNLIDKKTETQSVVNGKFLTELTHAKQILGFEDPLEYVFQYRPEWIRNLPPAVRMDYLENTVQVVDPKRVRVIPFGQTHVVGPTHRPVHANFHGHQGANGAKSSPRSHASANQNSIVGDSHQSGMLGGSMVIGTSTPKQIGYNDGGYSSWNNSFAVVYPDGTKQLVTYSSLTGTFEQRPDAGMLPPEDFFGDQPLRVTPTDNQIAPDANVADQHTWWVNMLRGNISK